MAALRDPDTKVAYDARRFAEAFLAVGDSTKASRRGLERRAGRDP
jgi:hypothetical protein